MDEVAASYESWFLYHRFVLLEGRRNFRLVKVIAGLQVLAVDTICDKPGGYQWQSSKQSLYGYTLETSFPSLHTHFIAILCLSFLGENSFTKTNKPIWKKSVPLSQEKRYFTIKKWKQQKTWGDISVAWYGETKESQLPDDQNRQNKIKIYSFYVILNKNRLTPT